MGKTNAFYGEYTFQRLAKQKLLYDKSGQVASAKPGLNPDATIIQVQL